jgi:hypothetical protein
MKFGAHALLLEFGGERVCPRRLEAIADQYVMLCHDDRSRVLSRTGP